jgi:Helix-turn-helix domain
MSSGDSGPYAGPEIGQTLELARKERDLSLGQVEEATKIRAAYLRELERENFDVLPAVYVQGSLKTYANFLQLDGEAMVRELKRRQTPQEKPSYPLYVGPQEDDSLDDILTAVGGVAGAKSQVATEEDRAKTAAPPSLPAGINRYLYLGSAAFVVLLVVAALVLNAAGDGRPAVSQVREPLISQAPETSSPEAREEARVQKPQQDDEKSAGDEKTQPEHPAGSEAQDDKGAGPTTQNSARATPGPSPAAKMAASAAEQDAELGRRNLASIRASAPNRQMSTAPQASPRPIVRPGGAGGSPPPEGTAPQASPRPIVRPGGAGGSPPRSSPSSSPRGGGELQVKVVVGGKDPVQLTGGPFED